MPSKKPSYLNSNHQMYIGLGDEIFMKAIQKLGFVIYISITYLRAFQFN